MLGYAVRRIAGTVPTLLILVTLSFFVIRLAPGGPFDQERTLTPEVRANLDHLYGLDRPLGLQYLHYLGGLAHGDLGLSYKLRDESVAGLIAQGLPVSATVGFAALAIAILFGVPLGTWAALRRGGAVDYAVTGLATLAIALPTFVTGPLLALVFGLALRWLPVAGWEQGAPVYLILPAVTLALPVCAAIARMMRGSLLETLSASYVRTARARGLGPWRVLLRHALRPALLPVVSYLGPAATYVFTGSLVVETVFSLPGTGRYLVQGALDRDYMLVMGMIILYGALTLLLNLAADLAYGWLDPRVRHE
ncbi:MAG TPA: ABC transporter permease subunit [Steroidobacteraceae bacterium]|nr:ABC transporter permease subunit [Steroidobacteraceae bacterium]